MNKGLAIVTLLLAGGAYLLTKDKEEELPSELLRFSSGKRVLAFVNFADKIDVMGLPDDLADVLGEELQRVGLQPLYLSMVGKDQTFVVVADVPEEFVTQQNVWNAAASDDLPAFRFTRVVPYTAAAAKEVSALGGQKLFQATPGVLPEAKG
jgi:hypothetical protein